MKCSRGLCFSSGLTETLGEGAPELLGRDDVDLGETIGENKFPDNPDDLLDRGYNDVSHPEAAANGKYTYENPETGDTVRFDEGTPGAPGNRGADHYHQFNPNATGNSDLFWDVDGNPVPKGSQASHIYPGDLPGQ
jgi:hypothetical protein